MTNLLSPFAHFKSVKSWEDYIEHASQKSLNRQVKLSLKNQGLTDEHICPLAEVLKYDRRVTKLNLSDNQIGDVGIFALAKMLEINTFIALNPKEQYRIKLDRNKYTKKGMMTILNALLYSKRHLYSLSMHSPHFTIEENWEINDSATIKDLYNLMRPSLEDSFTESSESEVDPQIYLNL